MGVDVKGVNTIVHFGPSSDIDDYCQESGRGGRDGSESYAILINYSGSSGRYKTSDGMKYYVNNEEICRRELLLEPFGCKPNNTSSRTLHLCCDICACRCKCGDGACGDPVGGKRHIEQKC
ncbi:Bloom syndrome protein-like [Holothuria leucospilota]|uniref:DNA 3'-5' helicase n=1 Tax=Holothuria leucospilota TaxID=206669 RepID=A0A9Q1CS98_HOLLE|nr:Bloom syndrome protein-like [Holothuria leucospilota]